MTSLQTEGCSMAEAERSLLERSSLTDPALRDHPQAFYAAMRNQEPVFYDEKLGMWLVSRFEDAQIVFRDSETYSAERGYNDRLAKGYFEEFKAILESEGGGYFPDAIKSDPPAHTRVRKLMDAAFSAHRVKLLEPQIVTIAAELAEAMAARGEADGVSDFAVPMTIRVICQQLGVELYDADRIRRWGHAMLQQIGMVQSREQMARHAREICDAQNFLIAQIEDRRLHPKEDMISDLVHARIDDADSPTLTHSEIVSLVRALMIAGHETTQTGMSSLLFVLASQPELVDQLYRNIDDDRFVTRFVVEMLRMEPPIKISSRMTTKETKLGGKTLPEGAHLLIVYGAVNGDERTFACPHLFDPERSNLGRNITFGGGLHRCIGATLATLEIKVAAREIVRRLDNMRVTIPLADIPHIPSIATHGIASLPIAFTRRGT